MYIIQWHTIITVISYITNKASSRLGCIRRTSPLNLPHLHAKAYTMLVRPILEYSSTVWDGSRTQTQATKLEAVHRRAARTVLNIPRTDHRTSTCQFINKLNWETLDSRRDWRLPGWFRAIHFGEVATDMTECIQIQRCDQQYFISFHIAKQTSIRKAFSFQQLSCGITFVLFHHYLWRVEGSNIMVKT